jgi:hypothetical protein
MGASERPAGYGGGRELGEIRAPSGIDRLRIALETLVLFENVPLVRAGKI